jgi:hypothetical protein
MVSLGCRVKVVPALVVHGDSHFWRIAIVHTIGTAIILISPVVLRVGDVVLGGMLAATVIGVVFIPALFVVFARLREAVRREPRTPHQATAGG